MTFHESERELQVGGASWLEFNMRRAEARFCCGQPYIEN